MYTEGELTVRLGLRAGRIRAVDIASTRAVLPPQLTRGRTADEVARTVPLLFSVCSLAQSAATAGALDAARGRAWDATGLARRSDAVRREAAIELLTRLLLDWPRELGVAPDVPAVAHARQAAPERGLDVCRAIARDRVYGIEASAWLDQTSLEVLDRWTAEATTLPGRLLARLQSEAEGLGRSDVDAMPLTDSESLLGMLPALDIAPDFGRLPDWHGRPVETGPLARRARHPLLAAFVQRDGNSVAARFVAQLVDLASVLSPDGATPAVGQLAAGGRVGVGLAETARGLLLHHAQVAADGRVERYRIVAPTEWNFHPEGALTRGLIGRPAPDAVSARRDASLLAQALDPCVAFRIEAADA